MRGAGAGTQEPRLDDGDRRELHRRPDRRLLHVLQWLERLVRARLRHLPNAAKTELLGVPAELITAHGAVSEPVARAMALGAVAHSQAQVSLAVTGVAGPTGGSPDKPVGTVWFGWAVQDSPGPSDCASMATATRCGPRRSGMRCGAARTADRLKPANQDSGRKQRGGVDSRCTAR